ncbi:MAG: hypothetical protein JOZ83_12015 [Silvibacterium sp.]|nr:hypothetical protein [Silvibacterium sp.]
MLLPAAAFAKDKKPTLPAYVLAAQSITVIIDPQAGVSIDEPQANQIAQKDVEAALMNWGRFEVRMVAGGGADLIVVVRKGHGRLVKPTISDPRQNDKLGSITPIDGGVGIGGQQGHPPPSSPVQSPDQTPAPQVEVGATQDTFLVYRGDVDDPLNGAPAWRYTASDALQSPSVPAVDKFRKAIADAEKAAAKTP